MRKPRISKSPFGWVISFPGSSHIFSIGSWEAAIRACLGPRSEFLPLTKDEMLFELIRRGA